MTDARPYEGSELALFAGAARWKRYWSSRVRRYLGTRVIEVGAGLGSNTRVLNDGSAAWWDCCEPDPAMAASLAMARERGELPPNVTASCGTLAAMGPAADTVVYIDVLEHVRDDQAELRAAAARLEPGGNLIVLAPAHGWLYSPFDAAIGHHRRYSSRTLIAAAGSELRLIDAFYLDSAGLLASAVNRFALRSAMPSRAQIAFWDNVLVPISTVTDRLTGGRLGKSVVVVWQRR